ncbi:3524_t:CDS:2 [Gigaspora margarita]|uniref:3524_t:CDS:1 n=1 Tax=Gigaspora margarita TaxID=4874 RepID=A0ABN7URX6_GIGMA|nr:3524_t:CDS:2 [Gigaspora margarita]
MSLLAEMPLLAEMSLLAEMPLLAKCHFVHFLKLKETDEKLEDYCNNIIIISIVRM